MLGNPYLAKAYFQNPEKVANDVFSYLKSTGYSGVSNRALAGVIGNEIARDPASAIKIAKDFMSTSPSNNAVGLEIIANDWKDIIFSAYKENPSRIISALSSIFRYRSETKGATQSSHTDTTIVVQKPIFVQHLGLFVLLAKEFGKDYDGVANAMFENPYLFNQLVQNQVTTIRAIKAFMSTSPDRGGTLYMLSIDEKGAIWEAYLKDSDKILSALSNIYSSTGSLTKNGFYSSFIREFGQKSRVTRFASNPDFYVQAVKGLGRRTGDLVNMIENDSLLFDKLTKNPATAITILKEIDGINPEYFWSVSDLLSIKPIAALFAKDQKRAISLIKKFVQETGPHFQSIPPVLNSEKILPLLSNYLGGEISEQTFFLLVKSNWRYAVELGRPLDDLHNSTTERLNYLSTLSKTDVLSLLLSDPTLFYTSSNNLLFDRLKSDFSGKKISDTIASYGLSGSSSELNLFFRAINYGRLSGTENSIFDSGEMSSVLPKLTAPLDKPEFDSSYFYLLANSIRTMYDAGMGPMLSKRLKEAMPAPPAKRKQLSDDDLKKTAAIQFLLKAVENPEKIEQSCIFDSKKYSGKDGKLNIVQVFDVYDTGNDHWQMSQEWFLKYGKPKTGANGEIVFETKDARITLFMGKDEEANKAFIKAELAKDPHLVLTFRGHSYSLGGNVPSDIFGNNSDAQILFIPGSCGSAGSIPSYLQNNSASDLTFIANTSTGKGQVTNVIIDILISEAKSGKARSYVDIIRKDDANVSKIIEQGGDPNSLKVTTIGEEMLKYVNKQVSQE